MFTRILVPLDGAQRSESALELAREMAITPDAQIFLLHVEPERAHLEDMAEVDRRLDRIAMEMRAQGVKVSTVTECGRPDEGIIAATETDAIDLIVLAPGRRNLIDALRHPSVTRRLLPQAHVPVLITPERPPSGEPRVLEYSGAMVIVPLDGSHIAEEALPQAVQFARVYGRPLMLVHVVRIPPIVGAGPETHRLARDTMRADEAEAHRYLQETRERLERAEGIQVETMVLSGEPAGTLATLAEAHPGSLLVMSSHGRTGLARLLMGSVALEIARATPIPALIVPWGKRAETHSVASVASRELR